MKRTIMIGLMVLSLFVMGCGGASVNYDGFAQCITGTGMVMFGSVTCPHCTNVKKTFGNSFNYIEYVECNPQMPGAEPDRCAEAGVQYLPHFEFGDGTELFGEVPFDILAEKTGCALP